MTDKNLETMRKLAVEDADKRFAVLNPVEYQPLLDRLLREMPAVAHGVDCGYVASGELLCRKALVERLRNALVPVLTDKQYSILLDLFSECNAAFCGLPPEWQEAYYAQLHERRKPVYAPRKS